MSTWTRPCACGLDVTANPDDPTPGVREHSVTPEHRAWRAAMESADRRARRVVASRAYRQRIRADVERVRVLREYSRGVAAA